MFEGAIGSGETPTLAALAAQGSYRRAISVFPSLTPVCLSSIATGAHSDIHEIPHLVWYDRREQRLVEYGSSFGAVRAAGIGQTLRDTLVNMNRQHLGAGARTLFESLADAGLRTAAVNFTAYRGRTPHRSSLPLLGDVLGPERFFFYNLFSSDRTGAPLSWRNRPAGSIDAYAAAVGRWLVTRDAFDFLVFYLSDYDYASHEHGPDTALETLQRCDDAIGSLVEAGGGMDAFLERYAVVVMADHGQTRGARGDLARRALRRTSRASCRSARTVPPTSTSSRAVALDPRAVAARLDGVPAAEVTLFREGRAPSRVATARSSSSRRPPGRVRALRRRLDPRPPRCARPHLGGAREPERRRGPRLGRRGLRVRRPRRRRPRRRRLARIARRRRHRGAAAHGRRRGHARRASSTSRRSSSPISVSRLPRTRSAAPREPLPSPNVIEPPATTSGEGTAQRVAALGRRSNWEQLGRFCVVGFSGYVVNLGVYALLFRCAGLHYLPAAVGSFLVAVANNYTLEPALDVPGPAGQRRLPGARGSSSSRRSRSARTSSSSTCSSRRGSARSRRRRSRSSS